MSADKAVCDFCGATARWESAIDEGWWMADTEDENGDDDYAVSCPSGPCRAALIASGAAPMDVPIPDPNPPEDAMDGNLVYLGSRWA